MDKLASMKYGQWRAPCQKCGIPRHVIKYPYEEFTCIKCFEVSPINMPDEWQKGLEVLRLRNVENMHWLPGETVEDLIAENEEHGVI